MFRRVALITFANVLVINQILLTNKQMICRHLTFTFHFYFSGILSEFLKRTTPPGCFPPANSSSRWCGIWWAAPPPTPWWSCCWRPPTWCCGIWWAAPPPTPWWSCCWADSAKNMVTPPPLPSQSGHAFYNGDSLSLLLQQKNIDINVIEREFTEDTAISLAIACDNHEGLALLLQQPGWQKLRGSTGGTRRKVWTRTKILSPNIRYFVAN